MSELPEWPDKHGPPDPCGYYEELSEAALARLRVAVRALKEVRELLADDCPIAADDAAEEALAQIGDLPE